MMGNPPGPVLTLPVLLDLALLPVTAGFLCYFAGFLWERVRLREEREGSARRLGALRISLEVAAAAALGLMALVLPVAIGPRYVWYDADFLPAVRNTVEGMPAFSFLALAGIGVLFGLFGRSPVALVGPATMVAFPLWTLFDMNAGGNHNLLPFEWLIYGFYSLFGLAGAAFGRLLRRANEGPWTGGGRRTSDSS